MKAKHIKSAKHEPRTPKGVSQNWDFIQSYSRGKKKKGGEFVSRLKRHVSEPTKKDSVIVKKPVDNTQFSITVKGEAVVVMPRKNGQFSGKQQVYSPTLAKKLGLVSN
jgi:hypothetical protein